MSFPQITFRRFSNLILNIFKLNCLLLLITVVGNSLGKTDANNIIAFNGLTSDITNRTLAHENQRRLKTFKYFNEILGFGHTKYHTSREHVSKAKLEDSLKFRKQISKHRRHSRALRDSTETGNEGSGWSPNNSVGGYHPPRFIPPGGGIFDPYSQPTGFPFADPGHPLGSQGLPPWLLPHDDNITRPTGFIIIEEESGGRDLPGLNFFPPTPQSPQDSETTEEYSASSYTTDTSHVTSHPITTGHPPDVDASPDTTNHVAATLTTDDISISINPTRDNSNATTYDITIEDVNNDTATKGTSNNDNQQLALILSITIPVVFIIAVTSAALIWVFVCQGKWNRHRRVDIESSDGNPRLSSRDSASGSSSRSSPAPPKNGSINGSVEAWTNSHHIRSTTPM